MTPFTGPEWAGWTYEPRYVRGGGAAEREAVDAEGSAFEVTIFGDGGVEIVQYEMCSGCELDYCTTLALKYPDPDHALKAINAIVAAGGLTWEDQL